MRTTPPALLLLAASSWAPAARADTPPEAPPPTNRPARAPSLFASAPALPVLPDVGPAEELRAYARPAERFPVFLGPPREGRRFVERAASFPSALRARWPEVHATLFLPKAASARSRVPAAVVVHHLGGSFDAEVYLARHLATNGVAALFVSLPNYGARREPGTPQGFIQLAPIVAFQAFQQAALDVIRAGDVLRSCPEVDAGRVGVVGVSLGAFVSAVARGVDPRLGRTVLVLGGGDLAGMFRLVPKAPELLARAGVDPALLPVLLRPVEPLTFASRVAPGDVLMLNTSEDEIVPKASTLALWAALGRPRIRWFPGGHVSIAVHVLSLMNATLDHLRGRTPL